jgi:glutamyl-tRNA synthetase
MIRGEVSFSSNAVDDKVLIKADGMATYHLAVVVDDYLMKITHAFRGEEWLPSAPVHILLWKYLGWEAEMPQWAHLPLILKPDGHGKLSKRDGDRLGFPVFAMNWQDPATNEIAQGFKEKGFLPEAFVNMLAMLGWNDGSGQEIFSLDELIEKFSIDRVHKGGAKFDFEKAKWFNHEWIKKYQAPELRKQVKKIFEEKNIRVEDAGLLDKVITAVKDRCYLLSDFIQQGSFFFSTPASYDLESVRPKWTNEKADFFSALASTFRSANDWEAVSLENEFKQLAIENKFKPGELQLPFRIMLVGGKFGPPVFEIAATIGKEETINRIKNGLTAFSL